MCEILVQKYPKQLFRKLLSWESGFVGFYLTGNVKKDLVKVLEYVVVVK